MTDSQRLRVMTLNIWNYNPPWERRRELILETIRIADSDVIGFQEIRHDRERDAEGLHQAEQLAGELSEYAWACVPAQKDVGVDRWEGLAVFSKIPFKRTDHEMLTRDPSDEGDRHQRIVLHAEIEWQGGPVHFLDTHLSLSAQARERSVSEIVGYADGLPDGDIILVGDLNAVPESPPVRMLVEAGFVDVWHQLRPSESGRTFSEENCFVEEAGGGRRIDYILNRPGTALRPVSCSRVGDKVSPDGLFPSDHFGLIADFEAGAA